MDYSRIDFKQDVEEILSICQEELKEIAKGNSRQATVEQIERTIIPEMRELLKMIEANTLPPKGQRWLLSSANITRGWNWDIRSKDKLVKKLPVLNTKYRHELD